MLSGSMRIVCTTKIGRPLLMLCLIALGWANRPLQSGSKPPSDSLMHLVKDFSELFICVAATAGAE